jgi:hypothetical protein
LLRHFLECNKVFSIYEEERNNTTVNRIKQI